MRACVCVRACVRACACVCLSMSVSCMRALFMCVRARAYMSVRLSVSLSVCLSVCPSVCVQRHALCPDPSLKAPLHSLLPQGLRSRIICSFSRLKKLKSPEPLRWMIRTSVMPYAWPFTRPLLAGASIWSDDSAWQCTQRCFSFSFFLFLFFLFSLFLAFSFFRFFSFFLSFFLSFSLSFFLLSVLFFSLFFPPIQLLLLVLQIQNTTKYKRTFFFKIQKMHDMKICLFGHSKSTKKG